MNPENCIVFKGTKDGIAILFHPDVDFETIKESLNKKVVEAAKFFDGVKTPILFKGREFTEKEEETLIQIISDNTTMNITFVKTFEDCPIDPLKLLPPDMEQFNVTKYHRGAVRSGQELESSGSIVVTGDVNPGGIVKAEGNIIVLGQLKGMAHAGCNGMTEAFVAALSMTPVQLRIADIITRFPEENKRGPKQPEYAYVENGQIYVMPLS